MHKGLTSKTKDNHKSNMHHSKDSEVMLGYPAPQQTLSRTFLALVLEWFFLISIFVLVGHQGQATYVFHF